MKLTHKLCGVALLAALSTGAILPTVTHAAENPLEWTGKG